MISDISFSDENGTPQEILSRFVENTGILLASIANDNNCRYLTYKYAQTDLKGAWEEVAGIVPRYSKSVLYSDTSILAHHGLTNRNLRLKFNILQHAFQEFSQAHYAYIENRDRVAGGI